jgi:hypothetical protein
MGADHYFEQSLGRQADNGDAPLRVVRYGLEGALVAVASTGALLWVFGLPRPPLALADIIAAVVGFVAALIFRSLPRTS